MNINELKQKRAALVDQSRAITSLAVETEKRAMTAEEQTNVKKIFADVDALDATIDAALEQRRITRTTAAADDVVRETADKTKVAKDDVNRAFRSFLVYGHFGTGKGAEELRALQSDIDTDGGFLNAPQQFVAQLIKNVDDALYFRTKATKFTINGTESLGVPTLTANPADAEWVGEITTAPEDSSLKFGKRELRPKPLVKLIKVSRQLMKVSALPIEQIIADRLAYTMALPQEKAFMTGTGANQPLGIFTASTDGIPTSRDVSTGNTTTLIQFDGLINAKYSLKPQYQSTAEWYFHRTALGALAQLKDGFGQYIWQPSKTLADPDMLLGRPVNQSEYVPNTFTTGLYVGAFCDLKNYWIAESAQLEIQRLDELYAANNQVGFISRSQLDGQPVLAEGFARVKLA